MTGVGIIWVSKICVLVTDWQTLIIEIDQNILTSRQTKGQTKKLIYKETDKNRRKDHRNRRIDTYIRTKIRKSNIYPDTKADKHWQINKQTQRLTEKQAEEYNSTYTGRQTRAWMWDRQRQTIAHTHRHRQTDTSIESQRERERQRRRHTHRQTDRQRQIQYTTLPPPRHTATDSTPVLTHPLMRRWNTQVIGWGLCAESLR